MTRPAELVGRILHNLLESKVGSMSSGPIATIAYSLSGKRGTINVLMAIFITAIISLLKITAVELSARVRIATPILLVELTSPRLDVTRVQTTNFLTSRVILVELVPEAKEGGNVLESLLKNLTSTDTNTTSIITIASSGALRPGRPLREDARILGIGTRVGGSASPGRSTSETQIASLIIRAEDIIRTRSRRVAKGLNGEITNKSTIKVSPVSLNSIRLGLNRDKGVGRNGNADLKTVTNANIVGSVLKPILNKGQVAITTISSLNKDLTSTDTGLEPVIEIRNAIISNGANTPVGPLGENAVNRVLIDKRTKSLRRRKVLNTKNQMLPTDEVARFSESIVRVVIKGGSGKEAVVEGNSSLLVGVANVRNSPDIVTVVVTKVVVGTTSI